MNRTNKLLALVLATQISLGAGFYLVSHSSTADVSQGLLLNADTQSISNITVEDSDGVKLSIEKDGDRWVIPEYHKLPASDSKVSGLLNTLATTRTGWAVASTSSSQDRFEVSAKKFQKHLTLSRGDDSALDLFLGTSPGFRQLHVRRQGDDDIYSVKLNSYDFPVKAESWMDKTLLQPAGEITHLTTPEFSLTKIDGGWQFEGSEEKVDKGEVEKLVRAVSRLSVLSAEEKETDTMDTGRPLTVDAGETALEYVFFQKDDTYFVGRHDYPQLFRVSKKDYEAITEIAIADLLVKAEPEEDNDTSVPQKQSGTDTTTKQYKGGDA